MAHEFIYTAYKLARHYPPDKTVLENISLSFYPGAKIGVLGSNGAGKSSLLKIMAGLDDGYSGEARLTARLHRRLPRPGAATRPGQGRQGQRDGRRRRRPGPHRPVQRGHGHVGRPRRRLRQDRQPSRPSSRTRSPLTDAWSLERNVEIAMDALRCPPDDADVTMLSGGERRRVALCRLLLCRTRPAAARRADQPPRRRVASTGSSGSSATTRAPSSPSPTTATSSTTSRKWILELDRGRGIPFEGNYSGWLEQKQERLATRGEVERRPASARSPANSSGCACRPRPARPRARPASPPTTSSTAEAEAAETTVDRSWRSRSRPARASATPVIEVDRTCARASATGC